MSKTQAPSSSSSRKRAAKARDEYSSDDGFVEDAAPKSKRSKTGNSSRGMGVGAMQKDDEGNEFWEISNSRRVQISQFKGSTMISIREFYTDKGSGKLLPGKKGISLPVDQYTALLEILPQVEQALKTKGVKVPRPLYGGKAEQQPDDDNDDEDNNEEEAGGVDDDDDDGQDDPEDVLTADKRTSKSGRPLKAKPNHEATSDEDSD